MINFLNPTKEGKHNNVEEVELSAWSMYANV